ncbi:hypothetical protein DINM_005919 [Dirofilaria immitis]|nr:hypothetical protein [Dirofilaria immitis]
MFNQPDDEIIQGYHASVHDLSNASSSSAVAAASQQHSSTTPDSHPLVLGGVTPLTAGGTQTSISLTAVSSPSGSSSAGGQRLDSTPHSVETPNQLLTAQQQDNVSDTDGIVSNDYCTNSMPKQQQQQNQICHNTPLSLSSSIDDQDITDTTTTATITTIANTTITTPTNTTTTTDTNNNTTITTKSPILMMSLTKRRGIFPKPATNIMRAWLFHHLTDLVVHVGRFLPGDESLSMCGSLNDDGGRESVLSEGNTGSGGGSATGANKRKVPKVFSKEAITKFRAWLFQNLTHDNINIIIIIIIIIIVIIIIIIVIIINLLFIIAIINSVSSSPSSSSSSSLSSSSSSIDFCQGEFFERLQIYFFFFFSYLVLFIIIIIIAIVIINSISSSPLSSSSLLSSIENFSRDCKSHRMIDEVDDVDGDNNDDDDGDGDDNDNNR